MGSAHRPGPGPWLVALVLWALVVPASAHEAQIVGCDNNMLIDTVTKLGELVNANGTLSEYYDRNGDGKVDIEAVSYIRDYVWDQDRGLEIVHDPHPFLYKVDRNLDGIPDTSYIDKGGEGKCEDIVPYEDLPGKEEFDSGREGRA